ncbi:hypothetical protein ACJX0J_036804, partial [Zea mays]
FEFSIGVLYKTLFIRSSSCIVSLVWIILLQCAKERQFVDSVGLAYFNLLVELKDFIFFIQVKKNTIALGDSSLCKISEIEDTGHYLYTKSLNDKRENYSMKNLSSVQFLSWSKIHIANKPYITCIEHASNLQEKNVRAHIPIKCFIFKHSLTFGAT